MHRCASKNQPSNDHSGPASADPQNLKFGMLAVQRRIVDDETDLPMLQHSRYSTELHSRQSPCLRPDDDIRVVGAGEGAAQAGPTEISYMLRSLHAEALCKICSTGT